MKIAGDWMWDDAAGGFSKTYDAVRLGPSWNGWVTPYVTREVLDEIIRDQQATVAADLERLGPGRRSQLDRLGWYCGSPYREMIDGERHTIERESDGTYGVSFNWVWEVIDE